MTLCYLLSSGINHAVYAMNPPSILNKPVYIHFRFVYKINRRPQSTPSISHAPKSNKNQF